MLRDQLRLEASLPVAGNLDRQLAKITLQRLLALAVAGVAGGVGHRLVLAMSQVLGHLRIERTLDQQLGQLLERAVLANQVFRLLVVRQQAIQQLRRHSRLLLLYGHRYSL